MKKTVDIIGLQLVSITEGRKLGTVKNIVIDATSGTVKALLVEDRKWYLGAKFLPLTAVASIGEYAVTTMKSESLLPVTESSDITKLLEEDIQVIGTKVLTASGKIQGTVTELFIDEAGKIVECEIEDEEEFTTVKADKIVTFGKEVLVINGDNDELVLPESEVAVTNENVEPLADSTLEQAAEVAAPETVIEPELPVEDTTVEQDESTKKFDERQRKYLLGKKANRQITADNGTVIIENGGEITDEVLQKAKLADKMVELSMSI